MGVITRIGRTPGLRRFVQKRDLPPAQIRENGDGDDEALFCADCGREVLFDAPACGVCGGEPVTLTERARRTGNLPAAGGGPVEWLPRTDTTTTFLLPNHASAPRDAPRRTPNSGA